jgi:hypothetical protein
VARDVFQSRDAVTMLKLTERVARRALFAIFLLSVFPGCTVPMGPPLESPPLVEKIAAKVGTSYPAAVRGKIYTSRLLLRFEIGEVSVARFRQVFAAMFSSVTELPDSPPWRTLSGEEQLNEFDGIIELEGADMTFSMGNDSGKPDLLDVSYRVCLYGADGAKVKCWDHRGASWHQRRPFDECFFANMTFSNICITRQADAAIREAISLFLIDFAKDPEVKAWADAVAREREK